MKLRIAICLIFVAQQAFSQINPNLQKAYYKTDSLYCAILENNPGEAFKFVVTEDSLSKLIPNDSLRLLTQFHKAQTLLLLGIQDQALKELYIGLRDADSVKANYFQYQFNNSIGQSYERIGDYKNAFKFYTNAKQKAIECGRLKDTLFINFDIGLTKLNMGDAKDALAIIERNLKISLSTNDSVSIFFGLDNLAGYYAMTGDLKKALAIEKQQFLYPQSCKNNYRKNILFNHLSELAQAMSDWPSARQYLDSINKYAALLNAPDWTEQCYRLQSILDSHDGNEKSALTNYKKYVHIRDSLTKNAYDAKLGVLATLYDLDHKQAEINGLSKDKEISKVRIERLTLFLFVLGLLALLIPLYLLYRKSSGEARLKAQFAMSLLNAHEEERQRIAKELHDSVGQNILFIKNQLQNKTKDETMLLKSVDSALDELRDISKDLYPNQLEKYGLAAAVEALGEQVHASSGIFVSSDMQGIDQALNKNVQINFYRIIQEFVSNTLKHANATAIRITTQQTAKEIVLTVQDNGKGFDKAELERKSGKSFGLLNMEERIKMLKGKLEIESEPGKGTKSVFTIPV